MSENNPEGYDPIVARLGEAETKRASEARATLIQEHSASFRWVMASLLAINGGGMLLLKDLSFRYDMAFWISVSCFYIGIIAALAVAWLGQRAARVALDPLAKMETFWILVAASGEFHREKHEPLVEEMKQAIGKSKRAPIAGWISTLAFSLGILSAVVGAEKLPHQTFESHEHR